MQLDQIKRRNFIALLGGAAAWPLAARAQQPALPVIGWLGSESREAEDLYIVPFRQGLKETGYVEGQNLAIEYRVAERQYDRLPALAADLVRRQVSVIALAGLPAALAAKAATATIPIVFQIADDPIQLGLVTSLGRPGGNITGLTSLNVEVAPKLLELLHELVPNATAMALVVNPANSARAESTTTEAQGAARRLGVKLNVLHASTEREFDAAFAGSVELHAGALVIGPDSLFFTRSGQLGALASRHAIPAICPYRAFALAGGLMSYGTNLADLYRQVGVYTGRVLKGEKPADLPVQQAVKLELTINLKTARSLGLEVPMSMLMRVDEVIE
jgi:putative tryptophan/tyrosine transport system substrate-binding protein